jgi:hypothetical protein
MALIARDRSTFAGPAWVTDAAQLLEERHLVAWSGSAQARAQFVRELSSYLSSLSDTETVVVEGARIASADHLADQLGADGFEDLARSTLFAGPGLGEEQGVVDALRRRRLGGAGRPFKRRFILWNDANATLARSAALFGRLVDAVIGVAAEDEYASEEVLLIQRAIFIGSAALDVYAEDPRGQFRSWLADGESPALWHVVTGLAKPAVVSRPIERMVA